MKSSVETLFKVFGEHGYSLYIVGGAVRDTILKRELHDIDFTTEARPEEIEELFLKTNTFGERFGTVQVVLGGETFEITTFREEDLYEDGRHPEKVLFSTDLKEDLKRRDFTINALVVDENGSLIDCFHGLEDLRDKRLQTIGSPEKRFKEDGLRKWRAIRFAVEYALEIETETFEEILKNPDTSNISVERIREELNRILMSDNISSFGKLLFTSGLLKNLTERILPGSEVEKYNLENLSSLPTLDLRLTAFLREFKSEEVKAFLNGLKYEKRIVRNVLSLHKNLTLTVEDGIIAYKTFGSQVGLQGLKDLYALQEALQNTELEGTKEVLERIERDGEPLTRFDLKISGEDLKALGYRGKEIGKRLDELLKLVYRSPEKNEKSQLLEMLEENELN